MFDPLSGRARTVLAAVATVPILVVWMDAVLGSSHGGVPAADFAVFYTAGGFAADGQSGLLYDLTVFREAYGATVGAPGAYSSVIFGNSPPLAALLIPFTLLSFGASLAVWTLLSVAAAGSALRLVGLSWWAAGAGVFALIVTRPGASVVLAGQTTFFWLLVFAGVFVLLRRGDVAMAGTVAGLLILKPPLLIGFGIWWLIDRSKRKALVGLCASVTILITVTWPWLGEAWIAYPEALLSFGESHRSAAGQVVQMSPWSFFDLATIGTPVAAVVGGALLAIGGAIGLGRLLARRKDDLVFAFAISVVLTLWVSPHLLVHDWALLAVVAAVLLKERPEQSQAWIDYALFLAAAASAGVLLSLATLPTIGFTVQIAVPALALIGVALGRQRARSPVDPDIVIDLRDTSPDGDSFVPIETPSRTSDRDVHGPYVSRRSR